MKFFVEICQCCQCSFFDSAVTAISAAPLWYKPSYFKLPHPPDPSIGPILQRFFNGDPAQSSLSPRALRPLIAAEGDHPRIRRSSTRPRRAAPCIVHVTIASGHLQSIAVINSLRRTSSENLAVTLVRWDYSPFSQWPLDLDLMG
jgi:hypothetical protein